MNKDEYASTNLDEDDDLIQKLQEFQSALQAYKELEDLYDEDSAQVELCHLADEAREREIQEAHP